MSTPVTVVSAIPGVKDLWSLLAFLQDTKAVEQRLADLTTQETRLNARIAEVGVVGEVEALFARARADRQEAAELKAQAVTDAQALKAEALATRDAAVAETGRLRRDLAAQEKALAEAVTQAEKTARAREAAVAARELAADREMADAETLARTATAIQAEYETRLAKLKAAVAA